MEMRSFYEMDRAQVILIILFLYPQHISCLQHGLLQQKSTILRTKRHLVYPPPGNSAITKMQGTGTGTGTATGTVPVSAFVLVPVPVALIFGLGLPMEVDVSTIIGYVMKCNYILPSNGSYLTIPYIRYARSMKHGGKKVENFPSSSEEKGQSAAVSKSMTRYEIYKIVESAIDTFQSGRACLLKAICESAGTSLSDDAGLFEQLLHAFLTPSTSSEDYENPDNQEYNAAEMIGRRNPSQCEHLFSECQSNLLDYFTEVF